MALIRPYITEKFISYKVEERTILLSLAIWLKDDYTKNEPIGQIKVRIKEGDIKAFKNPSGYYIFTDLASGNFKYTVCIESDFYFYEEREFDASKIKTEDISLKFENDGPASGATTAMINGAAELQIDDIVEFHNPMGDIEQRRITNIDANNITISWDGGLKYDFTAQNSTVRVLKYLIAEVLLKPKPSYPFPDDVILVRGLIIDTNNKAVSNAQVKVKDRIETKSDKSGEFALYFYEIGLLFDWNKIPESDGGSDRKKLIDFLLQDYGVKWVKTANIEKIDNDKTIKISKQNNLILLKLGNGDKKVILAIDDGRTDEFIVKNAKDALNIFKKLIINIEKETDTKNIEIFLEAMKTKYIGKIAFP